VVNVDTEQARFNMVEQQIRPAEVLDQRVLNVLSTVPREDFVPAEFRNLAFADINIPLAHQQMMLTPIGEAKLLQALNIKSTDRVLEVGTGIGYLTALLANLASHVESVEIYSDLSAQAAKNLTSHKIENVTLEVGDAASGWDKNAPYDVIAVTGSLPILPESFKQALATGGRLFVIVGDAPVMESLLVTRVNDNEWSEESLMETLVPVLLNASEPQRFKL